MILGHKKQYDFLKKIAEAGKVPHAFLFSGLAQLGKKKIALEFLKLLNCLEKERPCQKCRHCSDIEKLSHPDLVLLEPLKKQIQIEQIRDLSWQLSLKPHSAPFKGAVIDQAHLMNKDSQGALLKTLEEPQGNAVLILVSEFPQGLFPTIVSRCQVLKFYPVNSEEIKKYLLSKGASEKKAEEISEFSFGRPGRAIELFLNPEELREQKKQVQEIKDLMNSDLALRFQYVKELSQDSQVLKRALSVWTEYFRGLLIENVREGAKEQSLLKLRKILKQIQTTRALLSNTNVSPRLALEVLMLEL